MDGELLTLEEVAAYFRVCHRTVRRWVDQGRLEAFRTAEGGAGRLLFKPAAVAALLESMREPAQGGAA